MLEDGIQNPYHFFWRPLLNFGYASIQSKILSQISLYIGELLYLLQWHLMFVVIKASKIFFEKYILIMYYILFKYVRVKKGVFRHVSDACQLRSRGLFTQTWTLNQRYVQLLTPFNFKVQVIKLLGELDIAHFRLSVLIFMASATSNFRDYLR